NSYGHQNFIGDITFFTDIYPDRNRMVKLYKVNVLKKEAIIMAYLYSPKKFQTRDFREHIACDLHPRVSPNGHYVCFDSPRTGKRSLCVMKI
ncbi:hypothetical protein EZS27_038134, partial [termite gut metagenome]